MKPGHARLLIAAVHDKEQNPPAPLPETAPSSRVRGGDIVVASDSTLPGLVNDNGAVLCAYLVSSGAHIARDRRSLTL
eukprot:SAG31_NODE_1439_length_8332_cov_11.389166_5_plen_78_part_00